MAKAKKEMITITLSIDDALDAGIAITLATCISRDRFPENNCYRIGRIFLKEVSKAIKESEADRGGIE